MQCYLSLTNVDTPSSITNSSWEKQRDVKSTLYRKNLQACSTNCCRDSLPGKTVRESTAYLGSNHPEGSRNLYGTEQDSYI